MSLEDTADPADRSGPRALRQYAWLDVARVTTLADRVLAESSSRSALLLRCAATMSSEPQSRGE